MTNKTLLQFLLLFLLTPAIQYAQQWDTLSPIPERFTFPVVTVLDGQIHIMGGGGTGGATDLHFAYDKLTDTWESKAPVPYKAQQPAGAAANGKIHFFGGGFPTSGQPLDSHYVYDPASDSWAAAAKLTQARAIHYAVALDDVLYSLAGQGVANLCQTYDPVNDAWITKNNLPDNQFWYGAHVATEGHIYRFGGGGYTAPRNFAHKYDPVNDSWSALPALPNATHAIKGAAIGDKIYLLGGYYDFEERTECWVFDTQTNSYTPCEPLPVGRDYHNVVSLDSCIYTVGGNHALYPDVSYQLLRLCPYLTSSTGEAKTTGSIVPYYESGILYLNMSQQIHGEYNLSVFDLSGRQILANKLNVETGVVTEVLTGKLIPSVYFIQLSGKEGRFTGKFVAK